MENTKFNLKTLKQFGVSNVVPIMFIVVCAIGLHYSGSNPAVVLKDVIARFDRNALMVLSLAIPILTGLGLNFGIVLGAMAGQLGLLTVCILGMEGFSALGLAVVITIPLAIFFGYLSGLILNKTRGQEMITSMILGFFAAGLYQLLLLVVAGGIVPIDAPKIMLPNGVGVRASVDLSNIKYILDDIWKPDLFIGIVAFAAMYAVIVLFRIFVKNQKTKKNYISLGICVVISALSMLCRDLEIFADYKRFVTIPMIPFMLIFGMAMLIPAILKTKLGQNMRAVGLDEHVASVAGIDTDKTRIIAVCISALIAALGQIMFLQNLGNFSTYNAHENVGMFSAAALLIGGASVTKATMGQAFLGTILFHVLFNVSPAAGKNIFGSAEIGEYFRVFVAYGIIAVTLALHAWKKVVEEREKNKIEIDE